MLPILLESGARSLLLGCAVWVVLKLLRPRAPQLRSVAWTSVLLASVTMPVLMLGMKALLDRSPRAAAWIPPAPPLFLLRPLESAVLTTPAPALNSVNVLWGIYALVGAALLLRLIAGVFQGRRLRNAAIRIHEPWTQGCDIRVSKSLAIPVTYRSTILLPADWATWTTFKRDAVLLHERSHIRRGDFYIHLLAALHKAVFWFNPMAWKLQAELLDAAEVACDDAAIRGGQDRIGYAEILVELAASGTKSVFISLAMARGRTVQRRVERVLKETFSVSEVSMIRKALMVAAFLPLAGFAASSWLVEAKTAVPPLSLVLPLPQQNPPAAQAAPAPSPVQQPAAPAPASVLAEWPEEVPDIMTPEEREDFQKLRSGYDREQFIAAFWQRRDPTPGTLKNEYKDEYYARIAEANQKFTTKAGTPGWKTDRGRIHVMYGPADEIESHPFGGSDPGGQPNTTPFERWRYRFIEGYGNNIILEFIDRNKDGSYPLNRNGRGIERLLQRASVQPATAPEVDADPLQKYYQAEQLFLLKP